MDIEEARKLLDQSVIDVDKVRKELGLSTNKISRSQIEKKAVVDSKIAPSDAYHHTATENISCPHCYSNSNLKSMGEIVVDAGPRPVLHCGSCNKVFSDLPTGIKILMDAAADQGAESVGFTRADHTHTINQPYNDNYESQQTNQKLDQVNSNLSMVAGNISNLNYTIQNLMNQVRELAEQNNKMMEQLANDPLIHMRKAITEFDLK